MMDVEPKALSESSKSLTGDEIRSTFLKFFADRGHKVIPSASLVPEDPTVLLTIAGMLPFKPIFLGQQDRPAARATSSQKCIRTNDIENVGVTARHHTFFEMLGNFSFGDYFKKEAIQWAWELITKIYKLDPKNLVISVFREDDEAELIWRDLVGVNPNRIVRMSEKDNFWSSGPTGPCGPCSEIYFDFYPELGDSYIDLEDDSRFIEFYNLVFMQYNRNAEGKLTPLENCNIDTGMGLERMAQILQRKSNNYETDLIFPLLEKTASIANKNYKQLTEQEKRSVKVIGDHSRAVTHLIADGVMASNLGRGYVLRRLLRRMVRHGRLIGINKPFLVHLGETAINLMKDNYPSLIQRRDVILQEVQCEEERFLGTLERGEKILSDILASKPKSISGDEAFELYDTYGFPLELTQEIAEEHQISVDIKAFEDSMNKQRQRAKAANIHVDLTQQDAIDRLAMSMNETGFLGYDLLEHNSCIQGLVVNGESANKGIAGDEVAIFLDKTVFYGEGGGQIGDRGFISGGSNDAEKVLIKINDVTRKNNVFIHVGRIQTGLLKLGDILTCHVDNVSRRRAQANHTATHLLQAALQSVVDPKITQAGSLVDFSRLRFDFHSSRAITIKQLDDIEKLINGWIAEAHILQISQMKIEEAKAAGAIAMFGEKYNEIVRVVNIPGVSMELCGGTHVVNTAEIGMFKLISESGIAAGTRRIEAVAGPAALDYFNDRDKVVTRLSEHLKAQSSQIFDRIIALQDECKNNAKALAIAQEELALSKVSELLKDSMKMANNHYLVKRLDGIKAQTLQTIAKELLEKLGENSAVVLGGQPDINDSNKVSLVVAFARTLVEKGLDAGKFIGPVAKICGGGGGGRSNIAQAGGRDAKSLDQALVFAGAEIVKKLA